MADWIRRHYEPRAEWGDETEARVASILHQEDCPCASPVHEAAYLDTARIVLSSIEAVPRAEHERVVRPYLHWITLAHEAESQLAALKARCEGVAKELRGDAALVEQTGVQVPPERLCEHADQLEGPDDAPKEPCKTCRDEKQVFAHGGLVPCPSCGSLPERDR